MAPMPSLDRRGYLVLMQLIRQMIPIDQWEPSLMRFTFGNVLGEIFAPDGQRVMLCDMDKTIYGLVIYGPDGYDMDYPGLLRQLEDIAGSHYPVLSNVKPPFMPMKPVRWKQMPKLLPVLLNACRENVSMRSSVFDLNAQKTTERINENYMLMQMHRWHDFIIQGLGDTVRGGCPVLIWTGWMPKAGLTAVPLWIFMWSCAGCFTVWGRSWALMCGR